MKERNVGIDVLKLLAIILITNSHMKPLYGSYGALATGGVIGDALFFFCSGFTLFLKPFNDGVKGFPDWYKRRINRIYPTVFAVAILFCTFWGVHKDINQIILFGGRWFVTLIMVYYVFIYFIGVFLRDKLNWVLAMASLVLVAWYYIMDFSFPFSLYADNGFKNKWFLFFIFMLFGTRVGMMSSHEKQLTHQWRNLLLAIVGSVAFYVMYGATIKYEQLGFLHVFTFLPMLMALYFIYLWADGPFMHSVYHTKWGNLIIRFVGGLCLEIYLIQNRIMTDALNHLFPLNLLIVFVMIVIAAYLLRCFSRFISQTFKEAPYDWKQMVSIY